MQEKGFNELTIHQRQLDLKKYFNPDFKAAWKKVCEVSEIHKRSNRANKVASILNLVPELRPNPKEYENFKQIQKEWNQKKNEHYAKKEPTTKVKKSVSEFGKVCEQKEKEAIKTKGKPDELVYLQAHLLCQLYRHLPDQVVRNVDFRLLQLRKTGNSKSQNFITRNRIVFGTSKLQEDKAIVVEPSKEIVKTVNRMRAITEPTYIYCFGGSNPLSQPGYSLTLKRLVGFTTNELRKMSSV